MTRNRLLWLVTGALVLAVAAWFRFWQIGDQILIDDEWHAIHKLIWAQGYRDIFLSFGHADYSIPFTLLFRWMAETIGLAEWRMRLLPLVFGLASVVIIPLLLRPWLKREATLLLAALLAVSPVLIHFSRYVRPYAIVLPLGLVAVIALWRWWHDRDLRWLAVYIPSAVLAGWLHPLTLLFTGSAMLWFVLHAVWMALRQGRFEGLRRVIPAGLATLIPVLLLILPPLINDPSAMHSKSGIHQVQLHTLIWAWHLTVGTAAALPMIVLSMLAAVGAVEFWRRDRAFVCYWLFMISLTCSVVVALQPAWIQHALVLLRYTLIALPMALALIALGLVSVLQRVMVRVRGRIVPAAVPATAMVILVVYAATGPLAYTYSGLNSFTNAARYYFDFDFERNVFDRLQREFEVPEVYHDMARESGDWEIIQGPWWFESHFDRLSEIQKQVQMPIRVGMISGLCADWTYGELRPDLALKIELEHFVFLSDVLHRPQASNRFVVLNRPSEFENVREVPPTDDCIAAFRKEFGAPWHEDRQRVVYRLPANDSA